MTVLDPIEVIRSEYKLRSYLRAPEVFTLFAEIDRLRERCAEQSAWIDAAVAKCAVQQCSMRDKALADAKRDARELLDQMRNIRTHLYAATIQRAPTDDRIIADHVEQAYLRARDVTNTMDARDD